MKLKFQDLTFSPKAIDVKEHTIRAIFSTADVDRHGEVVDQASWKLDDFMRNPVVLFSHNHRQPPVGKVTQLGYNAEGNLEGTIKFAAEASPFAETIWKLYEGGYMRAFSVGFASERVDIVDEQVILRDNTLYELSAVSVPANQMALAKSKGIDTSALEEVQTKVLDIKVDTKNEGTHTETAEVKLEEEKGEVADAVEEHDIMEKKWENMDKVWNVICALGSVYMDEETDVGAFKELVSEASALLNELTGDGEATSDYENAVRNALTKEESLKLFTDKFSAHFGEKNAVEISTEEVETEASKALKTTSEALVEIAKEGRVLSKKNRGLVQSSVDALSKLLQADQDEEADKDVEVEETKEEVVEEKKELDTTVGPIAIVIPARKNISNKKINSTVRQLLKLKRPNKS